jgi:hypothetical protein
MDASFGVCLDFLRCITLISHVLVYFDARFLGLIPESKFLLLFPLCSSCSSLSFPSIL